MMKKRRLIPRRRKDRRKSPDRRNGPDRRTDIPMDHGEEDLILNTRQACGYLQISRPTYFKYITTGKIKAKKIGRGWKVFKDELDRFVRGN
jgi:excisionase family DNA binding protein